MISLETRFPVAVTRRITVASDDTVLLAAARRGEAWALEQIYSEYRDMVYRLGFRLLGTAEDAEDALQMTFVAAFSALAGFRGESSVRTWLYRITLRQVSDLRRRTGVPPAYGGVAGHRQTAEDIAGPDNTGPLAEQIAVQRALARLKPEFRDVLVLRFWEGLDCAEIARVTTLSLPAVKMRLMRARAAFRAAYGAENPE